MTGSTAIEQEARLIILRELRVQPNQSITSTAMRRTLIESWLIDRPREWVEDQFDWLAAREVVRLTPAGSIKIATLLDRGRQHLALRTIVSGIEIPSEPVL